MNENDGKSCWIDGNEDTGGGTTGISGRTNGSDGKGCWIDGRTEGTGGRTEDDAGDDVGIDGESKEIDGSEIVIDSVRGKKKRKERKS